MQSGFRAQRGKSCIHNDSQPPKDTSLVAIVGLYDLLGLTQAILKETGWIGVKIEAYVFIGLIYWICCYSMSVYARRLETRLDTGRD